MVKTPGKTKSSSDRFPLKPPGENNKYTLKQMEAPPPPTLEARRSEPAWAAPSAGSGKTPPPGARPHQPFPPIPPWQRRSWLVDPGAQELELDSWHKVIAQQQARKVLQQSAQSETSGGIISWLLRKMGVASKHTCHFLTRRLSGGCETLESTQEPLQQVCSKGTLQGS